MNTWGIHRRNCSTSFLRLCTLPTRSGRVGSFLSWELHLGWGCTSSRLTQSDGKQSRQCKWDWESKLQVRWINCLLFWEREEATVFIFGDVTKHFLLQSVRAHDAYRVPLNEKDESFEQVCETLINNAPAWMWLEYQTKTMKSIWGKLSSYSRTGERPKNAKRIRRVARRSLDQYKIWHTNPFQMNMSERKNDYGHRTSWIREKTYWRLQVNKYT